MNKIRFGYKLWAVIILFLFTGFILNSGAKVSLYHAGYYLNQISNHRTTIIFSCAYLVIQIFYTINNKIFLNYIIHIFINKRVLKNLQHSLSQINNMSFKHYQTNIGSGQYLSAISQNFYFPFYGSALQVFFVSDIFLSISINIGFFFFFSWILGLISLLATTLIFFMTLYSYKYWVYFWGKIANQTNSWYERMAQSFKLFNFLYVYRKNNKIVEKNQIKLKELQRTETKFNNFEILFLASDLLIIYFGQIAFYLVSGLVLINTTTDANKVIGIGFFSIANLPDVLSKIATFVSTLSNYFTKRNIYAKFWEFSHGDPYPENQLNHYQKPFQLINIKGLNFNYPNQPVLFQNFNLTIQKNKKYLFLGSNGTGKSTLTKLLIGLERDYTGHILFNNDVEIKQLKQTSICNYVNWVTNTNILLDDSLRNNLTLHQQGISDDQIKASLKVMNLSELNQLDHVYQQGKNGLSVGQVQRLDIARCVLDPKPILVLDEALSNVDVFNQQRILNYFLSQKDLTFILITHHLKPDWQVKFDQVIQL